MELAALLHFVRTYKWLIGGAVVVAAILAGVVSAALPPTYKADARLVVGPYAMSNVTDYSQLLSAQAMAGMYAEAVSTHSVAERVIERLELSDTPELLLRRVTASSQPDSAILAIEVEDRDPQDAARIANDIAEDLIASSSGSQGRDFDFFELVQEQIAALRTRIADIDVQIARLQEIENPTSAELSDLDSIRNREISSLQTLSNLLSSLPTTGASSVAFLDRAVPPTRASSPQILLNVLSATILGLVLGLAVAAILRTLDDTIRTGDDVRTALGVPVLGVMSKFSLPRGREATGRLIMLTSRASPAAETFRSIRANLEFASRGADLRTVLVASPSPFDGRSTVAANLALAFAQAGRSIILVDADLRSPTIHQLFRLHNEPGLTTYLRSGLSWTTNLLWATETPNLRVLSSGPIPPSPADLLDTDRLGSLLAQLRHEADLVVIDSPPLLAAADAALLADHVDGAILVVRPGRTRRGAAMAAKAVLDRADAQLVGVVLNRRNRRDAAPEAWAQGLPDLGDTPSPWATPHISPSSSSGRPSEERR